jgi:hypothetical protein
MDMYSVHMVPVVSAPSDIEGLRALGVWVVRCSFFGGDRAIFGLTDDYGSLVPVPSPADTWATLSGAERELH